MDWRSRRGRGGWEDEFQLQSLLSFSSGFAEGRFHYFPPLFDID